MAEKKKDKGSGYQQQFFPNQVDYGTEPTDVEGPLPTSFQIGGFGGEDIGDYDQYGWLQDFINIFRPYIEGQDIDDIDRINRQKEANAFMDILRGVQNGTVDPNELRNFEFEYLSEIPGWNDYFQGVLENLDNGEDEGEQPDEFQGLYDKYGKDAVDAAKEKYDEIVKVLGEAAEDPFGAIEKIIGTVSSGTDECKDTGLPLPDWVRNCVTVGWLYGIPGLPLPPIPGVMGTTIGELEEGFKNIGRNVQDIFDGAETCGEDTDGDGVGNELCTWGEAIGRLGEWIVEKAEDAVDAVTDPDDIGDWISGILGPVLGGLVFTEVGDQLSDILFPIDAPSKPFDCATVNREGGMVIDEGSCEGCLDGFTPNEEGQCVPGECPPEMVKDELTGDCVEPLGCQPGGPCTTADGVGGRYNADCECIANVAIQGDDIRETDRTYTELPGFSFGSTPDDGGDDKDPIQGGDIDDSNRDYTGIIDIGGFDDDDDDDKDPIKGLDEICAGPKPTSGFALQTYERHCEGGSFNCDSQNRVTREDGSCGECKPGFSFDENFDQCVRDSEVTGTTSTETTETPSSGGGGGGGGMGAGAFAPFLAGISYTPQTLPEIQASTQPDYAQELESLITRQLAKRGMFT